jgi:N-acetylglucosamine-6-phosphate deacetylase
VHVHGGGGGDTMDASHESLARMASVHASHGTTAMCPATMAASDDAIERALAVAADYVDRPTGGSEILGVHLEGPFLNEKRRGAHMADKLVEPSIERLRRYVDAARGQLRILTIAPELPGALVAIDYARTTDIAVSIGHTTANYAQTTEALSAGAQSGTHVYNAMQPLTSREPGTVGALLTAERVFCEVIADGRHVHPASIDVLIRSKGPSRTVLVTDCMRPLGDATMSSFELSGMEAFVRAGSCFTAEGALCGSLLTMDLAQKNLSRFAGRSLQDAICMATSSPAELLGISDRKGSLRPGLDADLVICDTNMTVRLTMVGGKVVFRAP